MFIDEVADTLQTGELQAVGVSEGESAYRTSPVVACLGSFNLVVEQYDLRTGPSEDLVDCPDFAEYAVGIFHRDCSWYGEVTCSSEDRREYAAHWAGSSIYTPRMSTMCLTHEGLAVDQLGYEFSHLRFHTLCSG